MTNFFVTYLRLRLYRAELIPCGVYFGGIATTKNEADKIAKEIVNRTKGATALPKIYESNKKEALIDVMYEAEEDFEKMVKAMTETDTIAQQTEEMLRGKKKAKRRIDPRRVNIE